MARKPTKEAEIKKIAFEELNIADWPKLFADIEDPRVDRAKLHSLSDILMLTLVALVAGAESWLDVAAFGRMKADCLRKFLSLKNGIPSHDTIGRVIGAINPLQFQQSFNEWTHMLVPRIKGLVSVDGKTIRNSGDAEGKPAHIVSAFAQANRLVLAQVKTDEKSNEITAIPTLLASLELAGTIVSIDAMGCQRTIAEAIRGKFADYLLALKGNQPSLFEDVRVLFEGIENGLGNRIPRTEDTTINKGHGRLETRRCVVVSAVDWLRIKHGWLDLHSVIMVDRTTVEKGVERRERSYYISSRRAEAKDFNLLVRGHWSIENQLHWVLDVSFNEDQARARAGFAAENFALLRKIALNLIRQQTFDKRGVKQRRLCSAWNDDYLLRLLAGLVGKT